MADSKNSVPGPGERQIKVGESLERPFLRPDGKITDRTTILLNIDPFRQTTGPLRVMLRTELRHTVSRILTVDPGNPGESSWRRQQDAAASEDRAAFIKTVARHLIDDPVQLRPFFIARVRTDELLRNDMLEPNPDYQQEFQSADQAHSRLPDEYVYSKPPDWRQLREDALYNRAKHLPTPAIQRLLDLHLQVEISGSVMDGRFDTVSLCAVDEFVIDLFNFHGDVEPTYMQETDYPQLNQGYEIQAWASDVTSIRFVDKHEI